MLQEKIELLKQHPDIYCSEKWTYRISGNALEITVLPILTNHKSEYRPAVIYVGQVLKALSNELEKAKQPFLIQTFPSIENPSLIGSVRLEDHQTKVYEIFNKPTDMSLLEIIIGYTQGFQLSATEINISPELHARFKQRNLNLYSTFIAVTSALDNPFTWLKVGYLKEILRNQLDTEYSFSILESMSGFHEHRAELKNYVGINNNQHLQAVISV